MNSNELQGRWLINQRILAQNLVAQAWAALDGSADLCELLVRAGQLAPARAEEVRQAVASELDRQGAQAFRAPTESGEIDLLRTFGGVKQDFIGTFRMLVDEAPSPEPAAITKSDSRRDDLRTARFDAGKLQSLSRPLPELEPSCPIEELAESETEEEDLCGTFTKKQTRRLARSQLGESAEEKLREKVEEPPLTDSFSGLMTQRKPGQEKPSSSLEYSTSDRTQEPAPPPDEAKLPTITGFDVLDELRRNERSLFFQAQHLESGREVELELLLPETSEDDAQQFESSAKALAEFSHPNVARVRGSGRHGASPWLATEQLHGATLAVRVRESRDTTGALPDLAWTHELITSLARALKLCHRAGIIHGDLRPESVIVEEATDRPVLVSFQLVGDRAAEAEPLRRGEDIRGLGATLYFCLTGRAPEKGKAEVSASSSRGGVPILPEFSDESLWLFELCADAMHPSVAHRPNAASLVQRLEGGRLAREDESRQLLLHKRLKIGAVLLSLTVLIFVLWLALKGT